MKKNYFFIILLFIYILYCVAFIGKASVKVNNERYHFLFDDAMISMKYAKNLAEGNGLSWNKTGEKVEGYTNLLWTLYMSIPHYLKIRLSKTSLFIKVSALIFLLFNFIIVFLFLKKIYCNDNLIIYGCLILILFYLPLNYWSLLGMEVSILTLLITFVIYLIYIQQSNERFNFLIYIIPFIMIFIRIDMAVFFVGLILFMALTDKKNSQTHLTIGLSLLFSGLLIQTLFRLLYYKEFLPNTYYLKMTGYPVLLRIARGFFVAVENFWYMNWVLVLLPVIAIMKNKNKILKLIYFVFILQVLYSIYVGGDVWENWGGPNRYYVITMPLFFIIFSLAIKYFAEMVISYTGINKNTEKFLIIFLLIISFVSFNSIKGLQSLKQVFFIESSLYIEEFKKHLQDALLIKEITTPDAKIGVSSAGIIPYFSERDCIDFLGKNDKKIARMRAVLPPSDLKIWDKFTYFLPGHNKYDFMYSISQMPDINLCISDNTQYNKFLKEKYYLIKEKNWYLLKNSKNILWDKLKNFKNYN